MQTSRYLNQYELAMLIRNRVSLGTPPSREVRENLPPYLKDAPLTKHVLTQVAVQELLMGSFPLSVIRPDGTVFDPNPAPGREDPLMLVRGRIALITDPSRPVQRLR